MEFDERRLLAAIESHEIEEALALLARCVDAGVALHRVRSREGDPLVVLAIRLDQPEVLDRLLSLGCGPQEDDAPDDTDEEDDEDLCHGCSPLCLAVQLNHVECARVLIAHGAAVDAPSRGDGSWDTPLHTMATYNLSGPFFRAELLASATTVDVQNMADYTPLHLATTYHAVDAATALLDAGADVRATDAYGTTPCRLAAACDSDVLASLYLRRGVDINAQDGRNNTPLHEAAFAGQYHMTNFGCEDPDRGLSMIKLLVTHGADVNAENRDGNTAQCGMASPAQFWPYSNVVHASTSRTGRVRPCSTWLPDLRLSLMWFGKLSYALELMSTPAILKVEALRTTGCDAWTNR